MTKRKIGYPADADMKPRRRELTQLCGGLGGTPTSRAELLRRIETGNQVRKAILLDRADIIEEAKALLRDAPIPCCDNTPDEAEWKARRARFLKRP